MQQRVQLPFVQPNTRRNRCPLLGRQPRNNCARPRVGEICEAFFRRSRRSPLSSVPAPRRRLRISAPKPHSPRRPAPSVPRTSKMCRHFTSRPPAKPSDCPRRSIRMFKSAARARMPSPRTWPRSSTAPATTANLLGRATRPELFGSTAANKGVPRRSTRPTGNRTPYGRRDTAEPRSLRYRRSRKADMPTMSSGSRRPAA